MNDFVSQLRAEWLHAAFTAVFAGATYLLRRDLQRRDAHLAKMESDIANCQSTIRTHDKWHTELRGAIYRLEDRLEFQHYPFTD